MTNFAEDRDIDMLDYLREQSEFIDSRLESVIPREITKEWVEKALGKSTYDVDMHTLTESLAVPIWDFLDRGGKRWRPVLMLVVAAAIAGTSEAAEPLIPMIEFVHNGTLIHDDLEDDSDIRRGQPCIHRQYGVDIATNVGSAMYFLPLSILYGSDSPYTDAQKLRIYDLVVQELIRCHCGQGIDIAWHNGSRDRITESEYFQMCAYKTGVLARLAARLGAYVSGASEEQIEGLGCLGETLGVGFQIQDDILNLSGERFAEGKGRGEDIHEGKQTLLVWYAREYGDETDAARLAEILAQHPDDQATIDEAIGIIVRSGAMDYARDKARRMVREAWDRVDGLLDASEAKERLKSFAEFLIDRDI
jgi:geranylgeranyl pyrophosphate synthase